MKDLKIICRNVTQDEALVYARRALRDKWDDVVYSNMVSVERKETQKFDVYTVTRPDASAEQKEAVPENNAQSEEADGETDE